MNLKSNLILGAFILFSSVSVLAQNGHVLYEKGMKQLDAGSYSEAIAHFNKILAKQPKHYKAQVGRAEAQLALEKPELAIDDLSIEYK